MSAHAAVPDSLAGRVTNCTDFRTGEPIQVWAQHLLASGSPDSSWNPAFGHLCVGTAAEVASIKVPDGVGGAVVVWVDTAIEEGDVYAQRLSASGNVAVGWPAHGLAVCTAPGSQYALSAAPDGSGGVFVAWMDFREPRQAQVRVQHVAGAGAKSWDEAAVRPAVDVVDQVSPSIVADGLGGAFVSWTAIREGTSEIRVAHLNSGGTADPSLGAQGLAVITSAEPITAAHLSARSAGAWLSWESGSDSLSRVKVMALGPIGDPEPSWPSGGLVVSGSPAGQSVAVPDSSGGLVVVWAEGAEPSRLMAQDVNAAGGLGWGAAGLLLRDAPGALNAPSVASDGHGGILVAWEDYRSAGEADIWAQSVSRAGTLRWDAAGAPVAIAPGHQFAPAIASDRAGGALVTWVDGPGSARASFVRARPITRGDVPKLVSARAAPGRAEVIWQTFGGDQRSLTLLRQEREASWRAIVTHRPDADGLFAHEDRLLTPGSHVAYRLASLDETPAAFFADVPLEIPMPQPFAFRSAHAAADGRSVRLFFTLETDEPATLEFFDVQGRRLESHVLNTEGAGDYTLDAPMRRRLEPGLFFLRLHHGGSTKTVRMLVVR